MIRYLNIPLPKNITPNWIKTEAKQHQLFKIMISSPNQELRLFAGQIFDFKSAGRYNLLQLLRYYKDVFVRDKAFDILYPEKK